MLPMVGRAIILVRIDSAERHDANGRAKQLELMDMVAEALLQRGDFVLFAPETHSIPIF